MKIRFLSVSLFAGLLLSGCGKTDAPATTASTSAPAAAPAAKAAAPAAPKVVEITGNDQMKFSVTAIEAKVGEDIKVIFTNAGSLPKEAMGHNWVLLKPGTDVATFAGAAAAARDTDYIPAAMKDQVIAHTAVLGPRKSEEVMVKGLAAGEYTYVCTFPGHFIMMKGTLTVK